MLKMAGWKLATDGNGNGIVGAVKLRVRGGGKRGGPIAALTTTGR